MIRAVFDANVIVSGFAGRAGAPVALIDAWRSGAFQLVISDYILDEVDRAWLKPYFRQRFPPGRRLQVLRMLRRRAEVISAATPVHGVAPHRHDDPILSAAISANVDYLVTGDYELLSVRRFMQVDILRPDAFLALLT